MNLIQRHIKSTLAPFALFALSLTAASSQASLIGDTVECAADPSAIWSCDPSSAVVGAGSEFSLGIPFFGGELFSIDLGATSVLISYTRSTGLITGSPETLILSDLDFMGTAGKIDGISNFVANVTSGILSTDVTFTDDTVSWYFGEARFEAGNFVSFDLDVAPVSTPGTLTLLALGLGGIGYQRRKTVSSKES